MHAFSFPSLTRTAPLLLAALSALAPAALGAQDAARNLGTVGGVRLSAMSVAAGASRFCILVTAMNETSDSARVQLRIVTRQSAGTETARAVWAALGPGQTLTGDPSLGSEPELGLCVLSSAIAGWEVTDVLVNGGAAPTATVATNGAATPPVPEEPVAPLLVPSIGARAATLRIFESGATVPAREQRTYTTRIDSATARFINIEVALSHPELAAPVALPATCTYFTPAGGVHGRPEWRHEGAVGVRESVSSSGWGWSQPGHWGRGTYRVTCQVEGNPVGETTFTVDNRSDLPALNGRVTAVRLFESGREIPDRELRQYGTRFDAAAARFINIELDISYPAPGRAIAVPFACTWFRPDGGELATAVDTFRVEPAWVGQWKALGRGWETPGNWSPGAYRVACTADGAVFAAASFEIVRGAVAPAPAPLTVTPVHRTGTGAPPSTFALMSPADPPGRRDWALLGDGTWIEVIPGGTAVRYRVVSRITINGIEGTVVRRIPDEQLEVFLPDHGLSTMVFWRLTGKVWNPLAEIIEAR